MRRLYHTLELTLLTILGVICVTSLFLHFSKNSLVIRSQDSSNIDQIFIKDETPKNDPIKPTKILILGDMMFDRGVRSQINSKGFDYVFGPATELFTQYDSVIANLEGPITSFESKTVLPGNKAIPGFQFTFPTNTADALKKSGIDIVSLANNHAYNFGSEGLVQTRTRLADAGVHFFGSPENNTNIATSTCITTQTESGKIVRTSSPDKNDTPQEIQTCIGFIGWHEFGTKNYQKVFDEIAEMRPKVDYLIVFPHWGVEYEKNPTDEHVKLAHDWLEAGADAVIGAHPHVVQKIEQYRTADGQLKPIFYSLGNFIFDQYFSFDTTHGIGVEIEFTKIQDFIVKYKIIPFSSIGSRVSFPTGSSTMRLFNDIEHVSGSGIWEWLQAEYI